MNQNNTTLNFNCKFQKKYKSSLRKGSNASVPVQLENETTAKLCKNKAIFVTDY